VAEYGIETRHKIGFSEATVLARSAGFMDRLIKEAVEIRLHPNNFNRDNGFMLSQEWYPSLTCPTRLSNNQTGQGSRGHGTGTGEVLPWLGNTETVQRPEGLPPCFLLMMDDWLISLDNTDWVVWTRS
jgi:hypothetical protein